MRELVSKSRDLASLQKSTCKSRAIKRNELSTNMASKFTKKRFLEQLRGSLPVSKHLSNEPKAETSCSFLVLHPSSGVHTVRCHFKLNAAKKFLVIISGCEFVRFLGYGNEIEPFAKNRFFSVRKW